jgi:hypothetical protein
VNFVIPALGAGFVLKGERLEYLPEYFIQHLSVCLLLLIQPLLWQIEVLDRNQQERDYYNVVR